MSVAGTTYRQTDNLVSGRDCFLLHVATKGCVCVTAPIVAVYMCFPRFFYSYAFCYFLLQLLLDYDYYSLLCMTSTACTCLIINIMKLN